MSDQNPDIKRIAKVITEDPDIYTNLDAGDSSADEFAGNTPPPRRQLYGRPGSFSVQDVEVDHGEEVLACDIDYTFQYHITPGADPTWGYNGGDPGYPPELEVWDVAPAVITVDGRELTGEQITPEMAQSAISYFHRMIEDSDALFEHVAEMHDTPDDPYDQY